MSTMTLRDGRTLGWEEYGDPKGKPVFFFHGTPGSRFFCPSQEITKKAGVRLICVERPGYGLSTFQPGRRILDWPDDITQLADSLGLKKFGVAGHSGGGPYTAACACKIPQRITSAAILCGAGLANTPEATKGMEAMNKAGFILSRYIPWPIWRVLFWLLFHQRAADPAAAMDRETGHRPDADEALISQPEVREICYRSEVEAFRPGLRGMAWDARLITRPWGFGLEEIPIQMDLWYGTADNVVTIGMGRYMAENIPKCRLNQCEGEGHLLIFPHWEEILKTLTSK